VFKNLAANSSKTIYSNFYHSKRRHCEERSDEAISQNSAGLPRRLLAPRNDEKLVQFK